MRSNTNPPDIHHEDRFRARLTGALLFSLLVHGLILSMQFGLPGIGLPSLELPWRERRAQALDLHVVLADAARARDAAVGVEGVPPETLSNPLPATAPPTLSGGLKLYPAPVATPPSPKENKEARRTPKRPLARTSPPRAKKERAVIALAERRDDTFIVAPPALDEALPIIDTPEVATAQAAAEPDPIPAETPSADAVAVDNARHEEEARLAALAAMEAKQREDALLQAQEQAQREAREIESRRQAEESARRQAAIALQQKQEQAAREQEEAKRREETRRREATRVEREALELEARKQAEDAARQQAALALQRQKEEAVARERDEAARRAMELEAKQRAEAQQAQRLEAARLEREANELQARRQAEEAERQRQAALNQQRRTEELLAQRKAEAEAAARRREREAELARGSAEPTSPAGSATPRELLGGGLASRALEQARRSEIFRNDAVTREPDAPAPETRRTSILGRIAQDVGLMMYVESWRLKIERNGNLNYQSSSVERARGDPVVTVAIRSDGGVENVTIHRSSGRPELDEAVRRIVRLNARYSAFPPELARRFDVIEIRRIWNFDDRLRILEEVR